MAAPRDDSPATSTSLPPYLRQVTDGCLLDIHLQPHASRTAVVGLHGDRLKIAVSGPPVDGQANRELCRFLAKELGVSKGSVLLVSGLSSRTKSIRIAGMSAARAAQCLRPPGGPQ